MIAQGARHPMLDVSTLTHWYTGGLSKLAYKRLLEPSRLACRRKKAVKWEEYVWTVSLVGMNIGT
jgi:hypothetical protein